MTTTGLINEKELLVENATAQNIYDFLLLIIREHLPSAFERRRESVIYHDILRVHDSLPLRDGISITTHYYIENPAGNVTGNYPELDFMSFKAVQISTNRLILYGGCTDHEDAKKALEKLWQMVVETYSGQIGPQQSHTVAANRVNPKMDVPIMQEATNESSIADYSEMTVGEIEERIEAGDAEAIAFWDKNFAPMWKQIAEALVKLGEASFENHPAKPFFDMLRVMSRSENPVHRAIIRPYAKWSLAEIKQKGQEWLQAEVEESGKRLTLPGSPPFQYRKFVNPAGQVSNPFAGLNSTGNLAFEIGKRALEASEADAKATRKADRPAASKRHMRLRTAESLRRLREIRAEAISNNRPIPKKAAAMDEAGISDKTWMTHDPDLWIRWDDISYRPEKP